MVVGFSLQVSKVLEMIDSLIARDKLDSGDLKLIPKFVIINLI